MSICSYVKENVLKIKNVSVTLSPNQTKQLYMPTKYHQPIEDIKSYSETALDQWQRGWWLGWGKNHKAINFNFLERN